MEADNSKKGAVVVSEQNNNFYIKLFKTFEIKIQNFWEKKKTIQNDQFSEFISLEILKKCIFLSPFLPHNRRQMEFPVSSHQNPHFSALFQIYIHWNGYMGEGVWKGGWC